MAQAFVYRPGLAFGGVDANTAGRELERIRRKYQQLAPRHVVVEAQPEQAPLHDAFEWDDTKAARRFREDTARNLIRSVMIMRADQTREPVYVHVKREKRDDNGYEPLSLVIQRPDLFAVAYEELRDCMVNTADAVIELLNLTRKASHKQRATKVVKAREAIEYAKQLVEAIA